MSEFEKLYREAREREDDAWVELSECIRKTEEARKEFFAARVQKQAAERARLMAAKEPE